jgi:dephospho-CoA kinase
MPDRIAGYGQIANREFFREEGLPVYDSDASVHALYAGEAAPLIERAFPGTTSDGQVDRVKLAARVVGDAAALARLESIVHPLVAKARDTFIAEAQARGAPIILLDVPLLFETGGERHCDAVVVVSAPLDIQRRRAFERPGMTEEKFVALVGKQIPDAEKRRRADFIVDSSQSFDHARAQVRDILRAIAKMRDNRG